MRITKHIFLSLFFPPVCWFDCFSINQKYFPNILLLVTRQITGILFKRFIIQMLIMYTVSTCMLSEACQLSKWWTQVSGQGNVLFVCDAGSATRKNLIWCCILKIKIKNPPHWQMSTTFNDPHSRTATSKWDLPCGRWFSHLMINFKWKHF